jgi:antitoxin ParD1/3/4/toxin ParE1/3/4
VWLPPTGLNPPFTDACVFLAQEPWNGGTRKDVTARKVHFWTIQQYPNYVVVYRPETQPLEIVRVLHGMRDLRRLLKS